MGYSRRLWPALTGTGSIGPAGKDHRGKLFCCDAPWRTSLERERDRWLVPSRTGLSSNGIRIPEVSVVNGMGFSLGGRDLSCTTNLVSIRGWEGFSGEERAEEDHGGGPGGKPGEDPVSDP
jgi:hypothetical protein